jgi:serine/threonine protein kinase
VSPSVEPSRTLPSFQLPYEALDSRLCARYQIRRVVAEGGMGRVYDAVRWSDGRRVALKILRAELAADTRLRPHLLCEAHALAVSASPLVVEFLEYGETSTGLPYLVLEWVDGHSLHSLISAEGPFRLERVGRVFLSLLEALDVVHARGIVHADVKPENVMVVRDHNQRENIRLVDFGVACGACQTWAQPGEVCGTPGYLAPEVMMGVSPSPASDLFAAGVVLYELLTGCAPWGFGSLATMVQRVRLAPPPPSRLRQGATPTLDALVARALAPAPRDRFACADELRAAFLAALPPSARQDVLADPLPLATTLRVKVPMASPAEPGRAQPWPIAPQGAQPHARQEAPQPPRQEAHAGPSPASALESMPGPVVAAGSNPAAGVEAGAKTARIRRRFARMKTWRPVLRMRMFGPVPA